MADDLDALYDVIDYRFRDSALLEEALTHPSLNGDVNYQRLEFLGDRVLGLAIAGRLYREYPDLDEGELAIRYNELVRRRTLAGIASEMGLGAFIRLSAGEDENGGREKPAILADCCESLIGALHIDGGFDVARTFINRQWDDLIDDVADKQKDAKTRLQEWAQGRGLATPRYRETGRTGPAHEPEFTVSVLIGDEHEASGKGPSKRAAEQNAANALLSDLGVTS